MRKPINIRNVDIKLLGYVVYSRVYLQFSLTTLFILPKGKSLESKNSNRNALYTLEVKRDCPFCTYFKTAMDVCGVCNPPLSVGLHMLNVWGRCDRWCFTDTTHCIRDRESKLSPVYRGDRNFKLPVYWCDLDKFTGEIILRSIC